MRKDQTDTLLRSVFFSWGWNQAAAFAAEVKYLGGRGSGGKKKKSKQPLIFLRCDIPHLPHCSQEPLESNGFKKPEDSHFCSKEGQLRWMNGPSWPSAIQILHSSSSINLLGISQSVVPALDVLELLTFNIQPRFYKILCAGTVLFPVIKGKPCDQRYVSEDLWLLLEKSTSDILTWVLN